VAQKDLTLPNIKPQGLHANASVTDITVTRWKDGVVSEAQDKVAEEVPIALIYNGISHAVMLATPHDLEDFALGFSLSEGILQNKSDLYDVEVVTQTNGIELRMDVASACFAMLKERRRNLTGRTGCGLCGAESLEHALRLPDIALVKNTKKQAVPVLEKVKAKHIQTAMHAMQTQQLLQQATGATHACAWVDEDGDVLMLREDVGRHNAMDKLLGALAKNPPLKNLMPSKGFVLTSSRASVEMVQKVVVAGYNMLVAISAPTGLAVRVAEICDVTLVGFLRDNQFVIYTHKHRVIF
jgi:FdhD protein